jgi:N-acetyl-anhydromuramyl-L-alanine amidase AmpD
MLIHDIIKQLYRVRQAPSRPEAKIDMIVVHHDAAPPPKSGDWLARLQSYAHQHAAEGWGGLGYHYAIAPDGKVYKCNPVTRATTHAAGANARAIGIMLMGNFHIDHQQPKPAQLHALNELVETLLQAIPTIKHVVPHRGVRHRTACPGQYFTDAMIPHYQS